MDFYKLNLMPSDTDFAFTDEEPSGFKDGIHKLMEGEKVLPEDDYPKDAHVRMSNRFGKQLGGLIGNTHKLLIVCRPMMEAIQQARAEPIQFLPLAIHNHKGRLASPDYFIVNPLGLRDCLDLDQSEIEYLDDDVVGVDTFVLAEKKVAGAPDIFRVKEDPTTFILSEDLVRAWIMLDPRPKNVYVDEVKVAPAKAGRGAKAGKSKRS